MMGKLKFHFFNKMSIFYSRQILKLSVVDLLLIDTPIVGFYNCSMFYCTFLYVSSSFANILTGERELVALLSLSS